MKPAVAASRRQGRQHGFTLIELLMAVLITAVILTLALPGYREQQLGTQRVEALRTLQTARQCELKRQLLAPQPSAPRCIPPASTNYRFMLIMAQEGWEKGYEWRAEPRGAQRGDRCGTLVLNHLGAKNVLGTAQTAVDCWQGR